MSSILKALKKLESEASPQNEFEPWPQKIDALKVVNKRLKKNRRLSRLLYIMVAAVFIASGGLLVGGKLLLPKKYSAVDMSPETKKTTADSSSFAERKTQGTVDPFPSKAKSSSLEPATGFSKKQPSTDFLQKKMPIQSTDENFQANRKPLKRPLLPPAELPPSTGTGRAIKSGPTDDSSPVSKKVVSRPNIVNSKNPPSTSRNTRKTGRLPSLKTSENPGLKVQAIAWFEDSKRRIAVINDRILREGENIGGYSLVQIGQDEVIVRKGGEEFKIVFR